MKPASRSRGAVPKTERPRRAASQSVTPPPYQCVPADGNHVTQRRVEHVIRGGPAQIEALLLVPFGRVHHRIVVEGPTTSPANMSASVKLV